MHNKTNQTHTKVLLPVTYIYKYMFKEQKVKLKCALLIYKQALKSLLDCCSSSAAARRGTRASSAPGPGLVVVLFLVVVLQQSVVTQRLFWVLRERKKERKNIR